MAKSPATGESQLIEMKAVDHAYPLFGSVDLSPAGSLGAALALRGGHWGAVADRELLERLANSTGGRYWRPSELNTLPRDISYSEAGISVRDTKPLWDMPINYLLLLGLVSTQWLLRRKWGVV